MSSPAIRSSAARAAPPPQVAEPDSEEWSWPAKGAIDDVRLYKRALSEEEIKAVYKAGVAAKGK